MTTNTDPLRALIGELRDGCVYHQKRWSGDTHADLGTYIDEGATDALMAKAADELESTLTSAPPSAPVGVDGLLADLETIWHSVSDDKETNAAYERLKIALAQQPAAPSAPVGVKRWPFVESPGEFTERLAAAMQEFPLIGAVRHVLIENPPALAQQPAGVDGMVMVQASDLKTLAEFADRGMRGNPAKLAALRAQAILAANRQEGE